MTLQTVRNYFELTFNKHLPALAAELYLHDEYAHHDERGDQSKLEFIEFFEDFFEWNPCFRVEILREKAYEDLVVLEVRTPTHFITELYRLKDGKIWKHWHVMQLHRLLKGLVLT